MRIFRNNNKENLKMNIEWEINLSKKKCKPRRIEHL